MPEPAPTLPGFDHAVRLLALWIEMGGSVAVVFGCVRGLLALARSRGARDGIVQARLLVADGVVAGLGFKLAAALLKTTELRSWDQIGAFAAILAIRTVVKQVLVWEEARLRARPRGGGPQSAV